MIKVNDEPFDFTKFPNGEIGFEMSRYHGVDIDWYYGGDHELVWLKMLTDHAMATHLDIRYLPYSRMDRTKGDWSFTYQYNTRDTFGFALKATQVEIDGKEIAIFKDPATDPTKMKKSLKGRCVVLRNESGQIYAKDGLTKADQFGYNGEDILETVFFNGSPYNRTNLSKIRERLLANIPTKEFV